MSKIKVSGRQDSELRTEPLFKSKQFREENFIDANIEDAIRIEQKRDGILEQEAIVKEDEIIELTFQQDNATWYVDYNHLEEEVKNKVKRGGKIEPDTIVLSDTIGVDDGKRGLGEITLKSLRVIGVDLPSMAAKKFAEKIENKLDPGPGLYHCTDLCKLKKADKFKADDINIEKPLLIFIHGTASSTMGSFGGLMQEEGKNIWQQMVELYDGQIFAFEHQSISESPLENAVDLVKELPANVKLHLVTHSRGGLVGEILARATAKKEEGVKNDVFTKKDIEVFEKLNVGDNRKKDIKALKELNGLFEKKSIQVERFVRVASPAAGTTLASGRLDLYLNTMLNLMKKIPFLAGSQVLDFTLSFLLATIKNRMNPNDLPGLEAMVPGSPLTRMLNDPSMELDSELIIISGSVQGGNIWQSFKVFLTNLYYRDDHDFVVNTKAMCGGMKRTKPIMVCREKGGNIHHFRYFSNRSSQTALLNALKGLASISTGFDVLTSVDKSDAEALVFSIKGKRSKNERSDKPIVFLVPGVMGSHLSRKKKDEIEARSIWPKLQTLANGGIADLAIDKPGIAATGLVKSAYEKLVLFLEKSHEVYPFPYDWRKSIESQADELALGIRKVLKQHKALGAKPKIRILGHSVGGLVAQVMIAKNPDIWNEIVENEGRLLMLGTPSEGSYMIPIIFMGKDRIIKMLRTLDLKHNLRDLLQIFTKFPGLLELLPNGKNSEHDFFDTDIWAKLKKYGNGRWIIPSKSDLKRAEKLKSHLKIKLDPNHCCYIAGTASHTPYKMELVPDDKEPIQILATSNGDGRVSWESGIPKELEDKCWYMPAEHGELCNHEPSFEAIYELLEEGSTRLLPKEPISDRGVVSTSDSSYVELELEQFPDGEELEAAALGYTPKVTQRQYEQKTIVCISHGDIGHAKFPVAVGHHRGDKLVRAEKALDSYLDNRLSDRHLLGGYPGPINTFDIILAEDSNHPSGGIIVGLGDVGELNENTLKATFYTAMIGYAFKKRHADKEEIMGVSSLLIGGVFSGLSIKNSLRSILSAVQEANQRIRDLNLPGLRPIQEFEFVEMYEDRAIKAAKLLNQLLEEKPLNQGFKINDFHLRRIPGMRRKIVDAPITNWWHRLKVESYNKIDTEGKNNLQLKFTSLTERARAEESNLPTQRAIVDDLIKQAVLTSTPDRSIVKAIFDLLIPNQFKKYSEELKNILWIVDEESAKYPWELLSNSMDDKQKPIAVRSGMLRQLTLRNYRTSIKSNIAKSTAFVVGDTESNLPALPGAQAEATEVDHIFKNNGFDSTFLLKAKPSEIITSLFEKDYQVVHLAGHGEFDPNNIQNSGMVLGAGVYLTPSIINQLTNIPELVFVNCCHLGKQAEVGNQLTRNHHELAANLGTQLIKMGVKAVVVAGWAIDDAAAKTFAKTFYRKLFAGENFGESVQKAREAAYDNHKGSNTWGAYQCYGDPFFEIIAKKDRFLNIRKNYVDPIEVIIELENIASKAEAGASRNIGHIESILLVIKDTPKKWLKDGQILEAIGNAFLKLNEYELAIEYFEQVKTLEKANYSVQLLERLANLKTKYGGHLFLKNEESNTRAAARLIREGIATIDHLLHIVEFTSERYSMLASGYKRSALVYKDNPERRKKDLEEAIKYYGEAYELDKKNGKINHYPLVNRARLVAILRLDENKRISTKIKTEIAEAKKFVKQIYQEDPNFWNIAAEADFCLFEILSTRSLKKVKSENGSPTTSSSKAYISHLKKAWAVGGSYFEKQSIEEQLEFSIKMVETSSGRGKSFVLKELKDVQYNLSQIWTD